MENLLMNLLGKISGDNLETIVIFKNMETQYFAAPYKYVKRIERVNTTDIENIENRNVIQYRGEPLRLYEISEIADAQPASKKEHRDVIVFKVKEKEFGLMVNPPMTILDVDFNVAEQPVKQLGILGTMHINDQVIKVLDVPETGEAFWMEVCNYV